MLESDNIPGNANIGGYGNAIDLNNGGWILIGILIALIVIIFAIAVFIHFKDSKTISKLKEFSQKEISDEEREILIKYRKLNNSDKIVINDTLNTLNKNHKNTKQ